MTTASDQVRDDIKHALADVVRVCESLQLAEGAKRQAGGLLVRCPSHAERNPSCSVQTRDGVLLASCKACGFAGDVYGLIAAVHRLDVRRDFPRVLEIAADMAGIALEQHSAPVRPSAPRLQSVPPPEPVRDLTAEWDALPAIDADGWEYLRSRGLEAGARWCRSPSPSAPLKLGGFASQGWCLALALRDPRGKVVAVQVRRIDDRPSEGDQRFRLEGPSGAGLFGQPEAARDRDVLVLCEGFTDTLAALVAFADVPRVAVVGIAGVKATGALYALPLESKRVLVALDADGPGDEAAAWIMAELTRRGAKPTRARPAGGKDLADMARAGVDLVAFLRGALTGFRSVAVAVTQERAERVANRGKSLRFGVRFLDLALGGIFVDDTILVGAKTGRGKTEFATATARVNAKEGKRVHYIALEAAQLELERRIKYPMIAQAAWADPSAHHDLRRRLNYLDWYKGELDGQLDAYERRAEQEIARTLGTMFVRYRGGQRFDAVILEQTIRDLAGDTDLVIVDHLHYVDTPDDVPENRAFKEMMKRIRDAQDAIRKPVVLVAHVRKSDRKSKQIIPDVEEFHGTSDVGKIATKAIMIAPAFDQQAGESWLAPTYIEPSKCRADGSRTRFVGLVPFNFRTGRYERRFELGRLDQAREKFLFVKPDDLPDWAIEHAVLPLEQPDDGPTPPMREYATAETHWMVDR